MSNRRAARRRPTAPRPAWYRRRGVQITAGAVAVLALIGALTDDDQQPRPATRPQPAVTVTETATVPPSPTPSPTPPATPSPTPTTTAPTVDATLDAPRVDVDRPRSCSHKWWC